MLASVAQKQPPTMIFSLSKILNRKLKSWAGGVCDEDAPEADADCARSSGALPSSRSSDMASACACSSSMAFCRTGLLPDGTKTCFCPGSLLLYRVVAELGAENFVALPKLKAIIMCLDKAHLCFLPLLESTALDNQDRLQSSRTCCHQCMHTCTPSHTRTLFIIPAHDASSSWREASWSGHSRACCQ